MIKLPFTGTNTITLYLVNVYKDNEKKNLMFI